MNTGAGSPTDSRYVLQATKSAAAAKSRSSVPGSPGSALQKVITVGSGADTDLIPGLAAARPVENYWDAVSLYPTNETVA